MTPGVFPQTQGQYNLSKADIEPLCSCLWRQTFSVLVYFRLTLLLKIHFSLHVISRFCRRLVASLPQQMHANAHTVALVHYSQIMLSPYMSAYSSYKLRFTSRNRRVLFCQRMRSYLPLKRKGQPRLELSDELGERCSLLHSRSKWVENQRAKSRRNRF